MFKKFKTLVRKAMRRRRRYARTDGLSDHHLRDVDLNLNELGQVRRAGRSERH
jgi:hypothetical protein